MLSQKLHHQPLAYARGPANIKMEPNTSVEVTEPKMNRYTPKALRLLKPVVLLMVSRKRSNIGARASANENLSGRTKFWIVQKPAES